MSYSIFCLISPGLIFNDWIIPAYTTYEQGADSVSKRQKIKFGRRGFTQKKNK
jgi:hypothetical protein